MKKTRFVLIFTLLAALLVGVVAAVTVLTSTGPTLVYDGASKSFTLENVPNDDLFTNFKNLMPGDKRTQDITLVTKNMKDPTALYLTSTPEEGTKAALAPLTLSVSQDGTSLGEFAHSVLTDVPLGVFEEDGSTTLRVDLSVPRTVGNQLADAQAALRWDFTAKTADVITITPASISSYVGGVSSNESGAPTLRFHVQLPNGVIWDNDRPIEMTLHQVGKDPVTMTPRKVEGSQSYYCFPTLERGLQFLEGTKILKGDYLTLTDHSDPTSRGGSYAVGLVNDPSWYITAVGTKSGRVYAVRVLPGDARIYVRYVSSDAEMMDAPSSALTKVVSDPAKVNTIVDAGNGVIYRKAVAVIDEDAVYYTNGKSSGLGSFTLARGEDGDIGGLKPLVALLFDDTVSLSDSLTDKLIEERMIQHAGHAGSFGSSASYSFDGWNYNFRYLDLVNYNDGNAWVSTDAETTIYWPYPVDALNDPEGYSSYDYQILHFQGMSRSFVHKAVTDIETWEKDVLHKEDGAVKVYSEALTLTRQGIRFTLEDIEGSEDNFSPFVLMWKKKSTGGNPGNRPGGDVTPGGGGGGTECPCAIQYLIGLGGVTQDATIEKVAVNASPTAAPTVRALPGYTFLGWSLENPVLSHDPPLVDPKTVTISADTVFYAVYSGGGKANLLDREDHYAYIVGLPDGRVAPNAPITRAEVATIFFRLLTDEARETYLAKAGYQVFDDVPQGAWYTTAVNTLNRMGIILGRTPTQFAPDANITRAEFATLAARFADGEGTSGGVTFTDIAGHWAEGYIQKAAGEGWVIGYGDGTYRPNNPITRAEAMTLVNRVLRRVPEKAGDLSPDTPQWPDNPPDAWYHLAVQEATHSHAYTRKGTTGEQWTGLKPNKNWLIYQ